MCGVLVQVIVFFPTARQTQLYSETFEKMGMPIKEMHSRKSQVGLVGVPLNSVDSVLGCIACVCLSKRGTAARLIETAHANPL